ALASAAARCSGVRGGSATPFTSGFERIGVGPTRNLAALTCRSKEKHAPRRTYRRRLPPSAPRVRERSGKVLVSLDRDGTFRHKTDGRDQTAARSTAERISSTRGATAP